MTASPRKPAPVTPERVRRLERRWRIAAFTALIGTAVLMFLGAEDVLLLGLMLFAVCLSEQSEHYGWRHGYEAREREERATAGERR